MHPCCTNPKHVLLCLPHLVVRGSKALCWVTKNHWFMALLKLCSVFLTCSAFSSAPLVLWLGKQAFRKPTALANGQNERCTPASSHVSMHWGEEVTQIWCKDVGHILKLHQPPKRSAVSFSVPSYFFTLFSTRTAIVLKPSLAFVNKIRHRLCYWMKEACWVLSPTLKPFYCEPSSINVIMSGDSEDR